MSRDGFCCRAALMFAAFAAAAPLLPAQEPSPSPSNETEERYQSSLLFAHVLELIRDEYVDPKEVNYSGLTYSALDGMLSSLDPYCEFLDPERYAAMKSDTEGEFGGLGIYVGVAANRNLVINMPVEGGPAALAGVMPGDWIVKIDGKSTKGMSLSEAVRALRGKPGEQVSLMLYRPHSKETKEVSIARQLINVPTVRGTRMLSEYSNGQTKVGYIRIVQFGEKTEAEFDQAMKQLMGQGMNALVLDLRNNPGGLLDAAVQIAGKFTPTGTVIVSTEGRNPASDRHFYQARGRDHDEKLPLVVLANRHSASAAEIVSGALKDLGRAVLVGETTYGKGSVQTVQPVDLDIKPPVGIRMTTAKYYTPSHNVIHHVGVSPNVYAPVTLEEEEAIIRKQNWHQLSQEEKDELAKIPDTQLDRGVSVLQGLQIFNALRSDGQQQAAVPQ